MGYLEDLIAEYNDPLFENHEPPPPRTETRSVVADTYDEMTWEVLQKQAPSLDKMGERMEQEYHTGRAIEEDVFNILYQSDPMMKPASVMQPDYAPNQDVLMEIAQSDEMALLRKQTMLDEYQTAFAMLQLEETLTETMVTLREIAERQQQAAEQLQQAQSGQGQPGGQPDPAALAAALANAKQVQDQNAQAAANAKQKFNQHAQQTAQDVQDANDAMAGYGVGGDSLQRMDFENRRALSQRLHRNRMANLMAMIGQFKAYGRGERRKKAKHIKSETFDYELSDDLTRLVPEEFNNLAVPELEELFWIRWQQHALLTKKERGPQKVGKGPVIVVCDESGSMQSGLGSGGRGGESREMWSKAVTFALCEQAKQEKRDFTYIGFASPGQQYQVDFPKGKVELEKIAELVEHFFSGGTSFEGPMMTARDLIDKALKRGEEVADIVFITDGDCYVDQTWIDDWQGWMKKNDIRTYGILIGNDYDPEDGVLERISSKTLHINKLNATPEGVQELFAGI